MRRLVTALALAALPALSAEVYVNGVNVDGLTNHTFEKVNVRLDEKGNVQIDAPGYSVKKVTIGGGAEKAPAKAPEAMTQKYFLVTEQTQAGATEYEVDLFLNGRFFRTIRSGDEQLVLEVTKNLRFGPNQLIVQAKKRYADPAAPKSLSRAHVLRVIIGEGSATQEQVTIEKQLVTFVRTAADTADVTQEFTFSTR